jgi:hypothetical protein
MSYSCFIIQLVGGVMVVNGKEHPENIDKGLHIYTVGTCLQEAVIFVFVGLSINFSRRLRREDTGKDIGPAKKLMIVLQATLGLICVSSHQTSWEIPQANGLVPSCLQNHRVCLAS